MPYLLVRHKASDFSKWKAAYDAHLPAREEVGLKEGHLLRNMEDPNDVRSHLPAAPGKRCDRKILKTDRSEVILLFETEDLQKAKEFGASADLREAMQSAGVVDKPDIYYLS